MFGEKILEYWDDIMQDCKDIIAIPSIAVKSEGEYPFGKNAGDAIDFAMDLSKKYGLTAKNVDYYACHAEIGEGEENAVVMAHLDVVPEGEGWIGSPYDMRVENGYIYGRGIADDKGSAIIALHCLRALKDAGVVGKRKLRVVMGSAEEIGLLDMPYYFAREQKPTIGFTPDSAYGVCNCEKGHMIFEVSAKNDSKIVTSFKAGTVVNAVPYKAQASVVCGESEVSTLETIANEYENVFTITKTATGADILAKGEAAHASTPEQGKNAASLLVDLLHKVFAEKIGSALMFAKTKIGLSYDGSNIGIKSSDEVSGNLTMNLGIVEICEENAIVKVDIRFPATTKSTDYTAIIETAVKECGLNLDSMKCDEPLYVPADSALVQMLTSAYKDVTGEDCDVFAMGGGTYAKAMGGTGVAFGPSFAGEDTKIHDCNENIKLESFKLHAQICLESMYRMYTQEV